MLLDFRCSNYRCIDDEISFSMIASIDRVMDENIKPLTDKIRVLPSAVIYGANGSGKSSIVRALGLMQRIVLSSHVNRPGDTLERAPYKPASDRISSLDITFTRGAIRYAYGFCYDTEHIETEYLYHFPKGKKAVIFDREGGTVKLGAKFRKALQESADRVQANQLLLSVAAGLAKVPELSEAYLFFRKDLFVHASTDQISPLILDPKTADFLQNDAGKELFLDTMRKLGVPVKDIRICTEYMRALMSELARLPLPEDADQDIRDVTELLGQLSAKILDVGSHTPMTRLRLIYDEYEVDLSEESDGIQRLVGMIVPLIENVRNSGVIVWDELESSLHEYVSYKIIDLLHHTNDPHGDFGQLICTTHDTNLLSNDLLRRDQIWFTEMQDAKRATDLYSLWDMRDIGSGENYQRGYISGKYGGLPLLNDTIAIDLPSTPVKLEEGEK